MSDSAPREDAFEAIEITPSGTVVPELPAGMLAKAWMDEYSRPLTWVDLRAWLADVPEFTWADLTRWLGEAG
jgi:hypothetical protein